MKCIDTLTSITFHPLALMSKLIAPTNLPNSGLFEFPCVKSLIFHYGHFDTKTQNFEIYNENMKFILKYFRFAVLREFRVIASNQVMRAIFEEERVIEHANLRWESSALHQFVETHRFPLRFVEICLYRTKFSKQETTFKSPRNLYEFSAVAPCLHEPIPESFQKNYWQYTLSRQTKLFRFTAQVELWGTVEKLFAFLKTTVIYDNFIFLHEICIVSYHRKRVEDEKHVLQYEVDFSIFNRCENLAILRVKILHLSNGHNSKTDDYTATHLLNIPWGLIELEITGILCPSDDLAFISNLPRLRSITLRNVGSFGAHGISYEVIRALVIRKTVRLVRLDGFNDSSDHRKLVGLVKKFNKGKFEEFLEIRDPSSQISCLDWLPGCCFFRYGGFKLL